MSHIVQNCNFVGVQFDPSAVRAITVIAEALHENARGLAELAGVFRASNITIESMLKITDSSPSVTQKKPAR